MEHKDFKDDGMQSKATEKNDNSEKEANDDIVYSTTYKVMRIPEIREAVFSFLPLKSIAALGLVCRDWYATAEKCLLKSGITIVDDQMLSKLIQVDFENNSLLRKVNKFSFKGSNSAIDIHKMEAFFNRFESTIKELTISGVKFRSNNDYFFEYIFLTPENLTKLDCVGVDKKFIFVVNMDQLKSIQTLRLGRALLSCQYGINVAPTEVYIKDMVFLNGRIYTINDFFDFRNLQILTLDCRNSVIFGIDLVGVIKLKSLTMKGVRTINWETSNWTVDSLTFGDYMNMTTSTGIKCEELHFGGLLIDMAVVPTTLKRLTISRYHAKIRSIGFFRKFQHLEYLSLRRRDFSILNYLQSCRNLTQLQILPAPKCVIDLNRIPSSVKVFRLSSNCTLLGSIDRQLQLLIVDNITFVRAYTLASTQLKAEKVIFRCARILRKKEFVASEWMTNLCQEYIVGPFRQSGRHSPSEYLVKRSGRSVDSKMFATIEINEIIKDWVTRTV